MTSRRTPPARFAKGEAVDYDGRPALVLGVGRERVNERTYFIEHVIEYVIDLQVGRALVRNAGRNQRWALESQLRPLEGPTSVE